MSPQRGDRTPPVSRLYQGGLAGPTVNSVTVVSSGRSIANATTLAIRSGEMARWRTARTPSPSASICSVVPSWLMVLSSPQQFGIDGRGVKRRRAAKIRFRGDEVRWRTDVDADRGGWQGLDHAGGGELGEHLALHLGAPSPARSSGNPG